MKKIHWGVIGSTGIAQKRTIPGMLLANNALCTAIMSTKQENGVKPRPSAAVVL